MGAIPCDLLDDEEDPFSNLQEKGDDGDGDDGGGSLLMAPILLFRVAEGLFLECFRRRRGDFDGDGEDEEFIQYIERKLSKTEFLITGQARKIELPAIEFRRLAGFLSLMIMRRSLPMFNIMYNMCLRLYPLSSFCATFMEYVL